MSKLNKKIVSLVVTVMMLASAFLIPGVFNFSRVSAAEEIELLVRFSNNQNLIASYDSDTSWKDLQFNSDRTLAVLENVAETIQIEFSNWDIKSTGGNNGNGNGNGQNDGGENKDTITVRVVSTGVVLRNILINYTQSQGSGGGVAINSGEEQTIIGNNLNFIRFTFDVYSIYTLEYVTNMEGVSYNDVSFVEGDSIIAPTPTTDGFTFGGWFIDNDFKGLFNDFGSMPGNDVTVYGQWIEDVVVDDPIEFVIDFIIVGETNELLESRTFDFEAGFGEIPTPTQEGFTFTGWFTNEELTDPADFDTLLNAEVLEYTVYGSWVMNEVEEEVDEIIDDEVNEDDKGDVDGDEDEDDEITEEETTEEEITEEETTEEETTEEETTEEETTEEETTEEETVVEDDGDVLGDSDEFVEEEERTSEEVDDDDKGEVLGDSDQLPEMSDTNYATIALFFLIIGLLTLVATKPEEEVI